MQNWIKDTIQIIKNSDDLLEVKVVLNTVKEKLGFDFFLYGVALPSGFTNIRHFIISDYPEAWLDEYAEKNYATIDPVVKHCFESHEPYCWDRMKDTDDEAVLAFVKAAAATGLVGGISIGVQSHAGDHSVLSFAADHEIKTGSDEEFECVQCLSVLLPYIHEAIKRLASYKQAETFKPNLTAREIDCLLWSAEGKTSEEIAQILSITTPTVTFHLKNVITKLEVSNRNQAIAKAVLYGIIAPQYSTLSKPLTYLF